MRQGRLKKTLGAIAAICVLMALVWFVVVDWAIKVAIESQGTKAVGAKVDVAKADLSLFPAGIEVLGLQVTDPQSPMSNAVAVKRIYSDIELLPLIKRKVIIDNLRLEGIRLNTPRTSSGAVPAPAAKRAVPAGTSPPWMDKLCAGDGGIGFSIPKVADILAREPLQSLQAAKDLRSKIDAAKADWQRRLNDLPGQKELEAYKTRLDKLKGAGGGLAGLIGSANTLKTLDSDLQNDLNRLKEARKKFQVQLDDLKHQSDQLAKAPREEARRLKAKYTVSAEGAANLSRLLFGPRLCQWWQKGYHWYARLKPYLGGSSTQPQQAEKPQKQAPAGPRKGELPDFLIRNAHIDALLETGTFTGEAADITSDPQIWSRPLTFKFAGNRMKQIQSISLNGVLDFMQPGNPREQVKMMVQKYALQNLDLGTSSELALTIAKAMADIDMDLDLSGPRLDALVKARLDDVKMAAQQTAGSEISKALAQALDSVAHFGLTALLKGNAPDYTAKIESDLDQVLGQAVGKIVAQAGAKLESQLQSAILEKTGGPMNEIRSKLDGLGDTAGELAKRLNLGDQLLKKIKLPF
jgi:uncharacterized protein (TIGR03545 family)